VVSRPRGSRAVRCLAWLVLPSAPMDGPAAAGTPGLPWA